MLGREKYLKVRGYFVVVHIGSLHVDVCWCVTADPGDGGETD